MNPKLIEAWQAHCKEAKHNTELQAADPGFDVKKHAAYYDGGNLTGMHLECTVPGCNFEASLLTTGKVTVKDCTCDHPEKRCPIHDTAFEEGEI